MARKSRKNIASPIESEYKFQMYDTAMYIRLSVEDKKKRGDSIETQKTILENFIATHPELRLFDIYIDNGATGTNFERPGFKRMMNDVESGKVNCVIVKDLSRLGRNAIDTGYYIEKYFPLNKVRFISANDNYDSNDVKNKNGGIIIPLKNMINEAYSIDIGRKIRAQAQQSMKMGDYIGARPPYGYLKAPDNCHKLIVNEDTVPVVRQIFEWAYSKVAMNEIVKRLNDANILPPSHYARSKGIITHENLIGNGKWQARTVAVILADEVYVGDMVQGKTKTVNHVQIPVDETNWIKVSNTHEPIVSREIFAAVKAYRSQVADKCIKRKKTPYTENIFKGKVFCGDCGNNLHRQKDKSGYYFFYCITKSRVGKGICNGVLIREDELRGTVFAVLQKKTEAIIGKSLMLHQNSEKQKSSQTAVKSKISELRRDIEMNRKYLKSLYESLVKNLITDDEYSMMKTDYEAKITSAMDEIGCLESGQRKLESEAERYRDMADSIKNVDEKIGLTAVLIEKLIDRIEVSTDKQITVNFHFGNEFDMVSGVGGNE